MLVNEVVKKTGLPKKTIYYYEEVGLIAPKLLENGYRNFEQTDIELLEKIALLRRIGMPIATIKSYLNKKIKSGKKISTRNLAATTRNTTNTNYLLMQLCSCLLNQDITTYLSHTHQDNTYECPPLPFKIGTKTTGKRIFFHFCFLLLIIITITMLISALPSQHVSHIYKIVITLVLNLVIILVYLFMIPGDSYQFQEDFLTISDDNESLLYTIY